MTALGWFLVGVVTGGGVVGLGFVLLWRVMQESAAAHLGAAPYYRTVQGAPWPAGQARWPYLRGVGIGLRGIGIGLVLVGGILLMEQLSGLYLLTVLVTCLGGSAP